MFKIKKVRPLFTGIVTTAKTIVGEVRVGGGLILDTTKMEGTLNNYQTVVAVGSMVKDLKPGDIVYVNYKRYEVGVHVPGRIEDNKQSDNLSSKVAVPRLFIDDQEYLFIQNNDIEYVVEDYEVDEGGLLQ